MECCKCKYYSSGQYSNRCELFQADNFTTTIPCTEIDDNYIFQVDIKLLGMFKGQSADNYLKQIKKVRT